MKLKLVNIIFSVLILISNIYFLYGTFIIIKDDGGPMGFGYAILPFSLIVNLGIISALLTLIGKKYNSKLLFSLNLFVVILMSFFLYLYLRNIK